MASATENIYQFKITLKHIKPPIWRRIQVPGDITFSDLHNVIQGAMGWIGYHLHQFDIKHPLTGQKDLIGTPSPDYGYGLDIDTIDENEVGIAEYFVTPKQKGQYLYDFGDGWTHEILLEKIISPEADVHYPRCVTGKRACPPEDCGGSYGYQSLLKILANPDHEEHKERKEWMEDLGYENFDPEIFEPNDINLAMLF